MSFIINVKDFLYYNRKYIFLIGILLLIFILYFYFFYDENVNVIEEENNNIFVKNEINADISFKVVVDIKGEVNSPGTYEISDDKRIIDVINLAGGLTENADTTSINLSKKVLDEMVIMIPKKGSDNNESVINENIGIKNESIKNDGRISINTASLNELVNINGIGVSKATAIIEYRNKNGMFKSIDEIKNVSGIGDNTFEKIKNFIKL